jgi:hypothetical protein
MSKVISLNDRKRKKISEEISDIQEEDYNAIRYKHIDTLADCLLEHDMELISNVCSRNHMELSLIINPVGKDEKYSVMLDIDPLILDSRPDAINIFSVYENSIALCMQALARDLKMYYAYIKKGGESL